MAKAISELLMAKLLEILEADEVLKNEVRAFRLSEPLSLTELPLIYVQLSPGHGEELRPAGASTYERLIRLDVCVVERHAEPEEADLRVLRLAERVCKVIASKPTLNGLAEDVRIERIVPEYGSLREFAIARARITVLARVMWRA